MSRFRQRDCPLTCESFVRHIPPHLKDRLAQHLDVYGAWEQLAVKIPADINHILSDGRISFDPLYDTFNISSFKSKDSPTKALLEDWGTEKSQIKHLIKLLIDIRQLQAAQRLITSCCQPTQPQNNNVSCTHSQIIEEVLSVDSGVPSNNVLSGRPPSIPMQGERLQRQAEVENRLGAVSLENHGDCLPDISYETLSKITGFDTASNQKLGVGGFAEVFLGTYTSKESKLEQVQKVAVKRLMKKDKGHLAWFDNELKMLTANQHENVVRLLGSCRDGALPCLVFEFEVNGSLEDKLAQTPLSVTLRLDIATGTAGAIDFLHNRCIVHRDIKTANILLDSNFTPKLCDFATSRVVPSMTKHTVQIIGTPNYIAPEAYDCLVQPSMDVFSFGIVLLELLTGLAANDDNRELKGLRAHVQNHCNNDDDNSDSDGDDEAGDDEAGDDEAGGEEAGDDEAGDDSAANSIFDLIDKRQGIVWPPSLVEKWYALSNICLKKDAKERDDIKVIFLKLKDMKI